MSNIVTAAFLNSRIAKTRSLWKFDNGMILRVSGIELPEYFEVHFSNTGDGTTTPVLGHNNEAEIPNDYLATGKEVNAYIYLHTGGDDGYTLYHATIPVKPRPKPNDGEPTVDQQEAIEAAIEALNTSAQDAAESAESAEASAARAEEAAASIDEDMIADAVADYLDEHPVTVDETDPTVPEWAKQPSKPSYTAQEVGAVPSESGKGLSTNDYTTAEKEKLAGIEAGADKTPDLSGYATKTELNGKVDKVSGKGLSTNDYTTAEKNKLSGIEAGADKTPDLSHYVTDSDYNPDSKTSAQTQSVGVDANGKLWTDPGGQGGTTDYDQLSNRPSINGHTLTGNQTAAQLGLATPSDIPAVPVQSVNGKTGAVELNASDVGAGTYSKPSGGIPKSDLASDVQTSLSKADTALQSVPSTYRTAAAQDTIDSAQDAAIAAKYTKPSSGIPASDLAAGVIPTVPTKTSNLTNDSGFVDAAGAAAAAPVSSVNGQTGAVSLSIPSTPADIGAAPAVTEVTISTAGAVTQALDAGKIYHFTGALTALTITLNAATDLAQYHFDFNCGSTAPTVTIPNTVTMPDSQSFDANKHYEVDILNNYGAVISWAIS